MNKLAAVVVCACVVLLAGTAAADASRTGDAATARAFIAGLNTAMRANIVRLLAPSVRFRTLTNPWVSYTGSARKQFVESGFGTNCALHVIRQRVSIREVRTEVEARKDGGHPCVGGQLGTRVVFLFGFNQHGRVATLALQNA